MNPLDENLEFLKFAASARKVVQRVLDGRPNPLDKTEFEGLLPEVITEILKKVEKKTEDLVCFALYASFERIVRDHVSFTFNPILGAQTMPTELARTLYEFLMENSKRWRMDDIIKLFSPPVSDQDISQVGNVRVFRHKLAHGESLAGAVSPVIAYQQLSIFLKKSGIIP